MLTLETCNLCPRRCGCDRTRGQTGLCGAGGQLRAAKAMIHKGEEPCLIGGDTTKYAEGGPGGKEARFGAGAVFFSGCNLRCVFCQNYEISIQNKGWVISTGRLEEIMLDLQKQGASCIDLVTPTPYVVQIKEALQQIRKDLTIPVVYNCGGYESLEAIESLDGLIDIYMPDLKYKDLRLSARYSKAADYFEAAAPALEEMVRQTGSPVFDSQKRLLKGTLVRHLVLPGCRRDSMDLMDYLGSHYRPGQILISLLRQYTPWGDAKKYPEIDRRLTTFEYESVVDRALANGLEGYRQGKDSQNMSLRPDFDGSGLQ